jgi:hypothetical protein
MGALRPKSNEPVRSFSARDTTPHNTMRKGARLAGIRWGNHAGQAGQRRRYHEPARWGSGIVPT